MALSQTNRQRPCLLLIRGLGHSGTTILDLALGAHPHVMGLGEAARILATPKPGEEGRAPAMLRGPRRRERICTCGVSAADCPIWGPALDWLGSHEAWTLPDKMRHLMQLAAAVPMARGEGPHQVLVDSFQDELVLPQSMPSDVDVRVIHLVRDVRSWLHSRLKSARQSGKPFSELRTLLRWWYVNRKFDRVLQQCGRPVFRLGYEELALQPERSLQLVCEWLGLPFSEQMLAPGAHSTSHLLSGNRMRFDRDRSRSIRYDAAWMASRDWPIQLSVLIPGVAALNRKLVYSNKLINPG